MKGIIIYKSNYGSTEQYAKWLAESTGFAAMEVKNVKDRDIKNSDAIVIGCPVFCEQTAPGKMDTEEVGPC